MMAEMSMGPLAPDEQAARAARHPRRTSTSSFVRIEGVGEDEGTGPEMQIYAAALYEIDGPPTKNFPEERAIRPGDPESQAKGTRVRLVGRGVMFPYIPKTYVPTRKPVGDGHDHGGGGHSH